MSVIKVGGIAHDLSRREVQGQNSMLCGRTQTFPELIEQLIQAVRTRSTVTIACIATESTRRRREFVREANLSWESYNDFQKIWLNDHYNDIELDNMTELRANIRTTDLDERMAQRFQDEMIELATEIHHAAVFNEDEDTLRQLDEQLLDDDAAMHGFGDYVYDDAFLLEVLFTVLEAALRLGTENTLKMVCTLLVVGTSPFVQHNNDFIDPFDDPRPSVNAQMYAHRHMNIPVDNLENLSFLFNNWRSE
jgi:hypothetical protein